jgi:hypothetical protein
MFRYIIWIGCLCLLINILYEIQSLTREVEMTKSAKEIVPDSAVSMVVCIMGHVSFEESFL